MTYPMILAPLFVQVLLTFALMLGMMFHRSRSLLSGETRFESIAMREPNWPKRATQFAYAFNNQFELPVLFFSQLVGAATGVSAEDLGLTKAFIDPVPLLEKHNVVVQT